MKKIISIILCLLVALSVGSSSFAVYNTEIEAEEQALTYDEIETLVGKDIANLKNKDPYIEGPIVPNIILTEEEEQPQYDKAVTFYVEEPNVTKKTDGFYVIATTEGTARIRAWVTNSSGLIQTDRKNASTWFGLASLVVSFIPGISLAAQTIVSIAATILGEVIDYEGPCDSKGYISYKYYYSDGEVYNAYGMWTLQYRTGRRYTYKHTWGAYIDSYGYYSQTTKDYTPSNGYSEIAVDSSSHYLQETWVKNESILRYWNGSGSYNECPW